MVFQLLPIDPKPQMVVHMDELVGERVLRMPPIAQPVLAEEDPILGREAARLEVLARHAPYV